MVGPARRSENAAPYTISAPVQADRTGDSIRALRSDITEFVTTKPLTQAEFDRSIAGATRSLSGNFETSDDVLRAMQQNDLYKRPDDYYATITRDQRDAAARAAIDPKRFVWVVTPRRSVRGGCSCGLRRSERWREMTADVDGVWDTVVKSPLGDQKSTLTVKSDGASFTGSNAGAVAFGSFPMSGTRAG